MRLVLVRHGRTASNVHRLLDTAPPGADLDDAGRAQAEALVERMAAYRVEAIYASNAVRAQQTAAPMASAWGLGLGVLPGLREIAAGDQELWPEWRTYIDMLGQWAHGDLAAARPWGESGEAFYDRFDSAIADILSPGHDTALLVSHGAALRMWVGGRVRDIDRQTVARRPLGNTGFVVLEGDLRDGWHFVDWDSGVEVDPLPPGRVPGRFALSDAEVADAAAPGWVVEGRGLRLDTRWPSDAAAAAFVADLSTLADRLDHHPDIEVAPGVVRLTLTSHDVGAVTHRDTAFAHLASRLVGDLGGTASH